MGTGGLWFSPTQALVSEHEAFSLSAFFPPPFLPLRRHSAAVGEQLLCFPVCLQQCPDSRTVWHPEVAGAMPGCVKK